MPRETNLAAAVKGICKGDIVVLFLPLSFYAKKESGGKKARIRGAALRMLAYASIWSRRFPLLCISPYDCSADSNIARYRPKCSAGITPRISYRGSARIAL